MIRARLATQIFLGIITLVVIPNFSQAAPVCKDIFANGPRVIRFGVSMDLVNEMQARPVSAQEARLGDALRSSGITTLEASQRVVPDHDTSYNYELAEGSIKDQNQSGRCWIFAGLSALENWHIGRGDIPPEAEFSRTYLHFFNMLERSNSHLENLIGARRSAARIKGGTILNHLKAAIDDGGYYEDFQFLVQKYGIVPTSAMPETYNSLNSDKVLEQLNTYLTQKSLELWTYTENIAGVKDGPYERFMKSRMQNKSTLNNTVDLPALTDTQLKLVQAKKDEILQGVWKILEMNLGRPPSHFSTKITPVKGTIELRPFTPKSFADDYLKFDPDKFVTVGNIPNRPIGQVYEVKYPFMQRKMRVLNVGSQRIQELIRDMILNKQPVWFAADVDQAVDYKTGVMHPALKNSNGLYPFTASQEVQTTSSSHRNYLGIVTDNHAMAVVGVDLPKGAVLPIKDKVQNSWSPAVGTGGNFHMYAAWIDQNLGQAIIDRDLLSPAEREALAASPVKLSPKEDYR